MIFGSVDTKEIRFLIHCFDDDAEEVDEQKDEGKWGRQKQDGSEEHRDLKQVDGVPHISIGSVLHQSGFLPPPDAHAPGIPQGSITPLRPCKSAEHHQESQQEADRVNQARDQRKKGTIELTDNEGLCEPTGDDQEPSEPEDPLLPSPGSHIRRAADVLADTMDLNENPGPVYQG